MVLEWRSASPRIGGRRVGVSGVFELAALWDPEGACLRRLAVEEGVYDAFYLALVLFTSVAGDIRHAFILADLSFLKYFALVLIGVRFWGVENNRRVFKPELLGLLGLGYRFLFQTLVDVARIYLAHD